MPPGVEEVGNPKGRCWREQNMTGPDDRGKRVQRQQRGDDRLLARIREVDERPMEGDQEAKRVAVREM
jgi:hypothetical protein